MDNTSINITTPNMEQYTTTYPELSDYMEWKITVALWKYISPILIITGIVGNLLSLLVMVKSYMSISGRSITVLYLSILAISDTLVLIVGLLRHWLLFLTHVDIRSFSNWGCKIHLLLLYWTTDFAAWVLLLVSIERVLSVLFAISSKRYLTPFAGVISLIVISIILLAVNCHFLATYELVTYTDSYGEFAICQRVEKYVYFFSYVWPWIDFSVFCIIPFTIISVCNIAIIVKLCCRKTNTNATSLRMSSITTILVLVSLYFLFALIPVEIYAVLNSRWTNVSNVHSLSQVHLFYVIANILMYSNNAANFFLYCLSGPRFRRKLRTIFCLNRVAPVVDRQYAQGLNTQPTVEGNINMMNMHTQSPEGGNINMHIINRHTYPGANPVT